MRGSIHNTRSHFLVKESLGVAVFYTHIQELQDTSFIRGDAVWCESVALSYLQTSWPVAKSSTSLRLTRCLFYTQGLRCTFAVYICRQKGSMTLPTAFIFMQGWRRLSGRGEAPDSFSGLARGVGSTPISLHFTHKGRSSFSLSLANTSFSCPLYFTLIIPRCKSGGVTIN